ncbi:class I SAM-dependent methyltransferase [Paenibacillus sp. UMB4589-SE434]|uniref:class I SAM-dependent methyltransferase n=1 Tax=Paenibacillus sp. UMB4589-SE434 TaxID=3046314 RepID=UPI00254E23E4|nr:class I SAM-dependent methyltransferase [Paenibacillus sp. UMB4589-SE434]MDK8181141.1 class I SAM-dependent methyltransferase [Paenibacillus sp. UMB4589-SE434]
MAEHDYIYKFDATQYDEMISKQPEVGSFIREIRSYAGLDVIDVGAGTGRLTTVLAPEAKSIVALDASEAMLQITSAKLSESGLSNWRVVQSDYLSIPLEANSADLVVAGWSLCYIVNSSCLTSPWEDSLQQVMKELRRVVRPGGTVIIMETMGTGKEVPSPPTFLTAYYEQLVGKYGFSHKWIRLDYEFENAVQAEQLVRWFFGDALADEIAKKQLKQVPECAGIWWLTLPN